MKVLGFSDLHCDLTQAARLVAASEDADLVVGAGDFASMHRGLEETIDALSAIETRSILVPGNNETEAALRTACEAWPAATVLHGSGTNHDGLEIFGLGAGIPTTPWDWSFDLDEAQASELLRPCPVDSLLVLHSPPKGHGDLSSSGEHLGSTAIASAIESVRPRLAVFGHIHESWGARSTLAGCDCANLGPTGATFEL